MHTSLVLAVDSCWQPWQHAVSDTCCRTMFTLLRVVHSRRSLMLMTMRSTGEQVSGPCMQLVQAVGPRQHLSAPCLHGDASLSVPVVLEEEGRS